MSDATLFKYKGILRLATWAELLAHINCHFQWIKSKKNTVGIKIHAVQLHFHFKTTLGLLFSMLCALKQCWFNTPSPFTFCLISVIICVKLTENFWLTFFIRKCLVTEICAKKYLFQWQFLQETFFSLWWGRISGQEQKLSLEEPKAHQKVRTYHSKGSVLRFLIF